MIIGLLTYTVEALEGPKCIPPSYLVKFTSPIDGKKSLFCQNGLQKDGSEFIYSKDGKLLEKNKYQAGKKIKLVNEQSAEEKSSFSNIKDIEVTYVRELGAFKRSHDRFCGCKLTLSGDIACFGKRCGYNDKLSLFKKIPHTERLFFFWAHLSGNYFHVGCAAGKETVCWIAEHDFENFKSLMNKRDFKYRIMKELRSDSHIFINWRVNNVNAMEISSGRSDMFFCGDNVEVRLSSSFTAVCKDGRKIVRQKGYTHIYNKSCKKIKKGFTYNYLLSKDGNLYSFFTNCNSVEGKVSKLKMVKDHVRTFDASVWGRACFLLENGSFGCIGGILKNTQKIVNSLRGLGKVKAIEFGHDAGCVLTENGQIACSGHIEKRPFVKVNIPRARLVTVAEDAGSGGASCALTRQDDKIYCWWVTNSGSTQPFLIN